ncbi:MULTISPECIES: T9SS type B sorting domain-containing protein [unclassified Cellulophaga]|uniref:T9SS type B sorting domain-containing protein n=1 Tax=unclassified Cellulophaga TaxID=2634405 RepID=UPI0026E2237E|nr:MULTISPECIES: T9SS type B sorting domain-containing protein [unclassified Cellulophaga]MDO6491371.1 T9SS type B sorting domain-containing protein [Cellulophaga sp. 2_MG-2023]MDO6495096.1 T9SS type B sorting domain-containing protein [Cellulophaga sp. 3_MG-2023]
MNKFLKSFLIIIVLAISHLGFSQVKNNFEPRYDNSIRGDLTIVANNIVNREGDEGYWVGNWWSGYTYVSDPKVANDPYNQTGSSSTANDNWTMQYIDIDGDPSTFSSSSAELTVPDASCSRVRYAGLYWSAVYGDPDRSNIGNIKFKTPGGSYVDISADEILFDGYGDSDFGYYSPYASYKDITSIVAGLTDPNGEYTVANIRASLGDAPAGSGGYSGGWTMVVVYENPTYPGKYITTFDGYAGIKSGESVDIPVSGFTTLPAPFPVNARLGVSTLEGDNSLGGDGLSIKASGRPTYTPLGTNRFGTNPNKTNNFFDSNVTFENNIVTTRNPNSINTLGWDADLFTIPNTGWSTIPNDETSAILRASSAQDKYDIFFTSFDVEIIEPQMHLAKRVEDIGGTDITGQGVNLGQVLDYVLSFQNVGNDDGDRYTIKDVLPVNVTLDETNITMPTGVTYTYDPATREVIFSIPNNLVVQGGPLETIRMRVRVAENCFDFIDACSDLIQNLAYSTYRGVINDNEITDDPSVTDFDTCGFTTPGATNFLLDDLESCDYSRNVEICGADAILDSGDGFDDYVWYKDENGNGVIDGGDTVINDGNPDGDLSTLVVDDIGVYIVDKIIADPCKGFQEIITVTRFGTTQTNPIIDLINDTSNTVDGEVTTCPIDGDPLPKIFLCGLNDIEPININIPDATSIQWEKLDEGSCTASVEDCANKNGTCTWSQVATGQTFNAEDEGQYRVVINYLNGCFTRFYFNVFKNDLDPRATVKDIICTTDGSISVTNVPANYDFQLLDAATGTILVPYSANNGPVFPITNNGAYTIEMRQQGVVDGCVFRLEDIGVLRRDYVVNITTKDTDCNGLGEIRISAEDVEPQYYFSISQGGIEVDTFGPTNDNDYTFTDLNDGVYDVTVRTDDGCTLTREVTINDVSDLAGTALTTKSIDCTDGIISVNATGGVANPSYSYAIWSKDGVDLYSAPFSISDIPASAYQTTEDFYFSDADAGTYEFIVVGSNNCYIITNEATVDIAPAIVYTPIIEDEKCFGAEDGTYNINVTNSNGYTLSYSLLYPDGTTTSINNSGNFTSLPQGNYVLTITQTIGGTSCDFDEPFTIGGQVDGVTGDAVLVDDYTCLQEATIQAQNVTGGAAPYAYSIDGVNFNTGVGADTFANLTNGSYTITIRDANLCTFVTNEIVIDALNPPTDLDFTATAPNCPTQTSNVTVTVANGNAPYVFQIIAPAAVAATSTTGNTATFNNLDPDTYTFRVTDDKGCEYEESFTIRPVDPISVTGKLVSNISCFDDTDGEAEFTVSGFNSTYNYTITGPTAVPAGTTVNDAVISLNNLDNGTYTITVTDTETNCTATADVIINAPTAALALNVVESQPTCTTDGSVTLTATGGWGSNSFTITYPDATTTFTNGTGTFNNLNQTGTFNVSVEDANGCIVTSSFDLDASVAPTLEIVPNNDCFTAAAGLELTANVTAGGDGTYQYRINGGAYSTNNVFSGLNPGTYTIDVIDGNNCTGTASITVNPELTVTASADNITACGTDAIVTITPAGGSGTDYVFAIVADGDTPAATDFTNTNPRTVTTGAGDYDVYVRDNNGTGTFCEAMYNLNIAQDPILTVSTASTDILCSGEAQSTITITAGGGEAPYQYSIDGGATFLPTNTFNNLPANSYNIVVRDANLCTVADTHTITEPFTLSASAAVTALYECNPTTGAEVRITNAQGGTPAYEYSFDGGVNYSTNSISNLLPGTHTLYIRDANLCTFEMTVTVDSAPEAPTFAPSISYDCEGLGEITVTPSSTDFDYIYSIDGGFNTPDNTSNVFTDVAAGNHTIRVDYTSNATPTPSNLLSEDFGVGANTSITQIDPLYCYEPQDGTVRPCDPGVHTRINDGEYSVTQAIASPFSTWRSPNDHTGNANGRFLAINVGGVAGVGGIVYAKRGIEVIPNRDITISTWAYNLLRTGESGGDPTIEIELVDAGGTVINSVSTGNIPKNNNANDWHNYTVTLNPGANTNLDIVIRTNSAVVDGNDIAIDDIQAFQFPEVCSSSVTFDVLVEAGKAFTANITNPKNISCFGGNDGEFVINASNFGAGGFEYTLDGGATYFGPFTSSQTVTGLTAQNYTIEVRDVDDNACSIPLTQELTEPTEVTATASITDEFTCNNTGATITAVANGGTPTYNYQLEIYNTVTTSYTVFRAYQTSAIFTDVPANAANENYIVRVQDDNLCTNAITPAVTVTTPEVPTFTVTPTACYSGANDGEIQVDVTSIPGNENFQFSINGGAWITPTPATATTYTFTNLANGTYTIDVKDGYGCVGVQETVVLNPVINATIDVVHVSSCADGSITVNATGGDGNLAYAFVPTTTPVTAADFNPSNTFTVIPANAGTYDVYVWDNNAADPHCEYMDTVTVNPATPLTYNAVPTDPTCHDGTGTIEITVTSGISPYTYEIIDLDNGGASNETTTNVINNTKTFFNLAPGNYTINVTDASGCTIETTPVLINNPDELVTDLESILSGNCDPATGFRFINYTTTLSGTLEFSHDGGTTWQTSDEFNAPTYTLTSGDAVDPSIRTVDASGNTLCRLDLPRYIISYPLDNLDITILPIIVNCNELQVSVQGNQGTAPYQYTYTDDPVNFDATTPINPWTTPAKGLSDPHTFTGLIPGRTYVFYVRDANGCVRQSDVNVNDIITLPLEITSTSVPACFGTTNGSITYTITDNELPYGTEYRWEVFNMITGTPVSVANSGGNIPFSSPQTVTVSGLGAGEYFIQVTERDSGVDSCISASENLLLEELDDITATLNKIQDISCATPGLIQIENINGGGGTYTFTVTGPAPFTTITGTTDNPIEIPANSPAGTYNVTIQDQYSCAKDLGDVIMTLTPNPTIDSIDIDNCAIPNTLRVYATSTAAQILYSIDGGVTYLDNGGLFTNLPVGTYNISIKDSNGCIATDSATIYPILEAKVELTKLMDCTPGTAEITIEAINGSGNYDYEISNGLGTVVARTALATNPLVATVTVVETYTIIVYDNNTNCNRTFTIDVPAAVTPIFTHTFTDVTCNSADDGTITLYQTDNGINPLTYTITPLAGTFDAATSTFSDLPPNTYTITATGTNGCTTDITNIVISEPNPIVIVDADVVEFGCTPTSGNTNNNASITIDNTAANITGGSNTYVIYEFINDNNTPATGDDTVVQSGSNNVYIETNTAGGSYTINVYDDKGCVGTIEADIAPYDELLTASAAITGDITCDPGTDGEITITATSNTNDTSKFEYSIDNGTTWQPSNVFGGLDVGTHNFLVRHTDTGCVITTSETITSPDVLELDATVLSNVICFGGNDGSVEFNLHDDANVTYTGAIAYTLYQDVLNTPADTTDDTQTTGIAPNGNFVINSLVAGVYYIEVQQTPDPRCTYTQAFTIAGPSAAITAATEVTPVTCVGNDGVIEVINATGGWGDYVYFVGVATNPAPVYPTDYVSNPRFTGLSGAAAPAGTDYQVWIADKNGCIIQLADVNLVQPTDITATLQVNQENCTNLEGEIEVINTVGGQGSNYTYQLIKDGTAVGSPQTTTIFSGLGAGSYTVLINDQWSCDFTTLATVLYEEMNVSTTVVKPIDCTVDPGGQITVNVIGGSTNLEFVATLPISSTIIINNDGVFTGLTEVGTYSFTVRDLDTNTPICEKPVTQELTDKVDPILLASTIENVSCFGLSDGSITANLDPATNVDPIYTYNLYDATGLTLIAGPQTSPTFTGLSAAFYQVEVVSAKECAVRETVEVTQPTELLISAVATDFACAPNNTVNTATITVTIEDGATTPGTPSGTSPYLYSIDNVNFQTGNTFTVTDTGVAQTITVYVKDDNSCPQTTTVTIEPINTFTAVVSKDTDISCAGPEEVTITVTDNGDVTNVYTYELLPIGNTNATQTATPTYNTATFELTAVGGYVFRITDTTTGCYVDTDVYNIAPYDLIKVSAIASSPVTCFGDTNGEIEVTVTDATAPFTYTVLNSDGTLAGINGNATTNTFTISGLSGGNYYVAVTEDNAPFCTEDSNVITIDSPDMALTATLSQTAAVTCDDNAGEIVVEPTGGYAPYDIVLRNNTTGVETTFTDVSSASFVRLSAATYTATVTDDAGCDFTDDITLAPAIPITADITPLTQMLTCFGDSNGSVSAINVLNGEGVYTYQLNVYDDAGTTLLYSSTPQPNPMFNNLSAGVYTITVSDGWNCDVETIQAVITEPTDITGSLVQVSQLTCVDPAEIRLTATGGTAPYEFSVDGINFTPMTGGDTHTFTVTDGIYQYYIRDNFNCGNIISNQVSIDPVPPLQIVLDETAAVINCNGESTASIDATAIGGLGNYSYELLDNPTSTSPLQGPQTTGNFRNLGIGTYYIKVTSDGGCEEVSRAITITEPAPLVIETEEFTDVSCFGEEDGTITVEVSGGTGEIKYSITPNLDQFDTKNVFTDLTPGVYDVIAQDEKGCFIAFEFTIEQPTAIQLSATTTGETCTGNEDGMATVTITGGTAPYRTSIDSNDPADYVLDRVDFSGLTAGQHVILVKDDNDCDANIVINITPGVNLKATATPVYECSTDTPTNYLEVVLEDNTITDVLYGLDTTDPAAMQLTPDFTNMSAGNHYLHILHANGCSETIDFTVAAFEPLTLVLENTNINEITAIAAGGNPKYTFYLEGNNNGEDNTFRIRKTDTYTVVVVDENGCEATQDIFIEFIDIEIPNFFTPNGDDVNNTWKPKNTEAFPNILTIIYDRYGRELYRMGADDKGWDGTYDNKELPSGDYWYTIKLKDEVDDREFVGHFTLYR